MLGMVKVVIRSSPRLIWCILLLGFFNSKIVKAGTKNIVLEHYSISQGLSNSVVNDIHQDKYGFIWIGTDDGLNCFNGYDFKVYRKIFQDTSSISSSFINTIYSDSKGRLWVGTNNGINLYKPECDCFSSYLPGLNIRSIVEDRFGNIILATDGGLRVIESLDTSIKTFSSGDGLTTNAIERLFRDRKDNILCLFEGGIIQYTHSPNSAEVLFQRDQTEVLVGLSQDIQGFLWLCTSNRLVKLDPDNNYQIMDAIPLSKEIIAAKRVKQLLIDNQNNFWIGSNTELYYYNIRENKFDKIEIIENNVTIEKTQTLLLYEDRMGNIWISQYGNGIFAKIKNKNSFNHFNKVPFNDNSLSNNIVSAFAEDNNNRIWVGTWGGGLNIYYPETNSVKRYFFKDDIYNKYIFRSLSFEPPSTLWAASNNNGVIRLNIATNKFIHYRSANNTKYNIPTNNLYCVFIDKKNNVFIGSGGGLFKYDRSGDFFVDISNDYDSLNLIRYVRIFTDDKYGNIWMGSYGQGLYRLNSKNTKVTQYKFVSSSTENQLNNNIIYSLKEDKRGFLWIGTMGGGLNIYDPAKEKFYHLTEENGLPNNIVNGILEDDDNLWIATNNGLCQFKIPMFLYSDTLTVEYFDKYDFTSHFFYYDQSDGIQSKEFKYAAAFKSSAGQMFFGGINGMNVFDPKTITVNSTPPIVVITDFYVHGKKQLAEFDNGPLDSSMLMKNEIHLKHDQNFFSFDFVAINYNNPRKNKYRYVLRNFDNDWIETRNRSASYMNLNPGKYVFELMASNNDGVWTEKSKKISIIIAPPIWGRLWFQSLFIFTLIGLLFAFYRYRIYRVKQRNIILEDRIERRTRQLKESNLILESQKKEILDISEKLHHSDQLKLRFFTNISHDFRTPLTLILGPLEKLLSGKEVLESTRAQLSYVYKNALKLLKLINELLDFRKLDTGNLNLKANEVNIIKFVKYICSFYEQHARNRNINFHILSNETELNVWVDTDLMEKVFSNLLSNAFKYTKDGGNITIQFITKQSDPNVVQISFEDDGIGISEEQVNLIFNRFYQVEKSTEKNQQYGSGIGLALCKEYIELHKGDILAKNKDTGGTEFLIELKKGKAHFTEEQISDNKVMHDAHGFNLDYAYEFIEEQHDVIEQPEDSEKPTVLAIDDNTDIQRYIIDILGDNYRVLVASNGEEGMKKAVDNIPDLILLDIMMPGMDGLKLGKKLKEDSRTNHIPLIILSARATEEEKLDGFQVGADDYIVKPFSGKVLKSRINARIRNRRKLIEKFKDHIGFNPNNIEKNSPDEEFIKRLMKILDKNLSNEDFNTAMLSSEMNLSRTQLYRKISAITEQSASEFIRSYKMRKAAELLSEGKYNVSEVAYKLGFKTLPHFTRTFTSVFNETPSKFISKRN